MEEMVTLWTRQDERSLRDIEKLGVFRNKERYIRDYYEDVADHFIYLYKWFANEAAKRVPKPDGVDFHIWCSISFESMLRPIQGTVAYKLEIPSSQVIYFDGGKWDYVLNHIYIPKDHNDQIEYLKDIEKKGFKDQFNFIKGKYAGIYPEETNRVMESWERVFQVDNWNIFTTQANIWEIRPENIVEIFRYEK
ncbi:MAG: DUF3841 domain-containing protein [Bacillota bacterium]